MVWPGRLARSWQELVANGGAADAHKSGGEKGDWVEEREGKKMGKG